MAKRKWGPPTPTSPSNDTDGGRRHVLSFHYSAFFYHPLILACYHSWLPTSSPSQLGKSIRVSYFLVTLCTNKWTLARLKMSLTNYSLISNIYIYICVCVCAYVCECVWVQWRDLTLTNHLRPCAIKHNQTKDSAFIIVCLFGFSRI